MMYNRAKQHLRNWSAGTWRIMLVTSSYTPDPDHDFVNDVVANEASGSGYARQDVVGRSVVINDASDRAEHNADNQTWASLTSTFRYAIIYFSVTSDADHELQRCIDLGAQSLTAVPFTIQWDGGASSGTVYRGT